MSIKYRNDIDALRGIAVLLVVLFHAFPEKLTGGFIGVDIFFVISGYLITSIILSDDQFNIFNFYNRRIRRLLPSLTTVFCASLLFGWLTLYPKELEHLSKHITYASTFVLNFGLIAENNYFDIENLRKPLMHLWTLSIEEQFYLFWPIAILLSLKVIKTTKPALVFLYFVVTVSFFLNIYFVESYPKTTFFNSLSRIWEIGCGAILAFTHKEKTLHSKPITAILGVILILITLLSLDKHISYPSFWGLLPCIGTLLIIDSQIKRNHYFGLVKLGLISYPLYLWHWVVFSFTYIYTGSQSTALVMLGAILFSVLLAFITYKYIEKVRYSKNKYTPLTLISLLIACLVFSQLIISQQGLPNRQHIAYLDNAKKQLTRSPATDLECIEHIKKIKSGEEPFFDYCRASKKDFTTTVAVIGDSHAHTLFEGLKTELNNKDIGLVVYANSSCPALIGFNWFNEKVSQESCQKKIKDILNSIEKDPTISTVLISTRGPVYYYGEVPSPYSMENIRETENKKVPLAKGLTIDNYISSLEKTIVALQSLSQVKEIAYINENPELGFSPKDSIARPFDFLNISKKHTGVSQTLYQLRMEKTFSKVQALTNKHKFKIIRTDLILCHDGLCPSSIEGKLAYADNNHLSMHGAHLVSEIILNFILQTPHYIKSFEPINTDNNSHPKTAITTKLSEYQLPILNLP